MKKLFVIYGGVGREREVSISSGKNIIEALKQKNIDHNSIIIDKNGSWICGEKIFNEDEGLIFLQKQDAIVFQVIHGTYGEDGQLIALLGKYNISFIGSSSHVMELTIDKYLTEKKLIENNIQTPKSILVEKINQIKDIDIEFPVIVKPKDEGSSVDLYKVVDEVFLKEALAKTLSIYKQMLVQEYIIGREFTCGVVEINNATVALFPTEVILTKGEMFDYEAKYTVGGCKEVTPAEIDNELTNKIKNLALQVHTMCGCKDISRTDMIMKENGELFVLEINTVPGMTKTSFIPAELAISGYDISDFVLGMIKKYS